MAFSVSFNNGHIIKKRSYQDGEERAKKRQTSTLSSRIDLQRIQALLNQGSSPRECALTIASPDLNSQIAAYKPREFTRLFPRVEKPVLDTLCILYTNALRNTSYYDIAQNLEKNIESWLLLIEPDSMATLVQGANELIKTPLEFWDGRHYQACLAYLDKIKERLNLFSYASPEIVARIENLHTYVRNKEGTRYPNCQKFYGEFCVRCRIYKHHRENLEQAHEQLSAHCVQILQNLRRAVETATQK